MVDFDPPLLFFALLEDLAATGDEETGAWEVGDNEIGEWELGAKEDGEGELGAAEAGAWVVGFTVATGECELGATLVGL